MKRAPPFDEAGPERWREIGFDAQTADRWRASGLRPYEAAVARSGGWTPTGAPHLRRVLVKILAR